MATINAQLVHEAEDRPSEKEIEAKALAFLQLHPGVEARHSGASLLTHLTGVHDKLKHWGCPQVLCLAGLFHSVYGTEHYRRQTVPISARPRVARVIGDEAEELAFRFCTLDTKAFVAEIDGHAAAAANGDSAAELEAWQLDLLHIFLANWLEQFPRMRGAQRVTHTGFFKKVSPLLIPAAAEEVEATYEFNQRPSARLHVTAIEAVHRGPEDLKVLDDFVPLHLQHRLSALMERNIWRYGWKAADTQTGHFFWHSHFAGDNGDGGERDCEVELQGRPLIAPVLELWHLIREQIAPGHVPVRAYANGHTFACDGHIHSDSDRPGHFTSIYYAHPEWNGNWGGETLFFDADRSDVVATAFPKPGRLVHFNGNIFHAARSPSRDCPALRSVVVIKTFDPALSR